MGATVFFSFNAFEGYFPSYAGKSREVVIGTCAFINDNPWRPGLVPLFLSYTANKWGGFRLRLQKPRSYVTTGVAPEGPGPVRRP